MFNEEKVKSFCGSLLSEAIQDECEKTGLMFVGRGRIMNFREMEFSPGKSHTIDVECDLWPEISYGTKDDGYKGLSVTAESNPSDTDKLEKVKAN